MPQFRYRAITHTGALVVGDVEASSREEVLRRIEYLGHWPIEAQAASKGLLGLGEWGRGAPRTREVTIFLRQLALLIGAGLTLEAALQTLEDDTSRALSRFARGLRSEISAGESFAETLERHPTIVEPMYVAMVRAGEASGKLETVLRAIVEDRTRKEILSERINAAIRYPAFLVISAALILVFFLLYVVPQFAPVFSDLGGRLNPGAALVLAASDWLRHNEDLGLGAVAVVTLGGWLIIKRRGVRARLIAALEAVPGFGGPMRDRRTARIIATLGLLIENGVTLPNALKILRDIITEPRYVAAVDRVHDQVRNGRRFADALATADLVPALAVRMLRVGDETGDLPAIAKQAARFYEHRLGIGLDRLMGAIGPATIILVSFIIGSLILSIMSALLSMTELAL